MNEPVFLIFSMDRGVINLFMKSKIPPKEGFFCGGSNVYVWRHIFFYEGCPEYRVSRKNSHYWVKRLRAAVGGQRESVDEVMVIASGTDYFNEMVLTAVTSALALKLLTAMGPV